MGAEPTACEPQNMQQSNETGDKLADTRPIPLQAVQTRYTETPTPQENDPQIEDTRTNPGQVNESLRELNLRAPPVPRELRGLPIDREDVVLREPPRVGTIRANKDELVTHIYLRRVPTALSGDKEAFMFRREKTGQTHKHRHQDSR